MNYVVKIFKHVYRGGTCSSVGKIHAMQTCRPESPCNNFILHTGKGEDAIRQNTSFVIHQYIKNNKLNYQQETLSQILEYGRGK